MRFQEIESEVYQILGKKLGVKYTLSKTVDGSMFDLTVGDNWEMIFSANDKNPYEVSFAYEKKIDDGLIGRKYVKTFKTFKPALKHFIKCISA